MKKGLITFKQLPQTVLFTNLVPKAANVLFLCYIFQNKYDILYILTCS